MNRCPKCGYQIATDMRFCAFCGSRIKIRSAQLRAPLIEEKTTSIPKLLATLSTIAGLLLILFYLCYQAAIYQAYRTRETQYISSFDDYTIYFLGAGIFLIILGMVGLIVRDR